MNILPVLKFNSDGLLPAIVQNHKDKEVLMLAWMNAEAFTETINTGLVNFWSRSRQELWLKGETSGNLMKVIEINVDCDADTLLIQVEPAGPACHTGSKSCFFPLRNLIF